MPGFFQPIPRRQNYGRPSEIKIGPWPRGLVTRFTPEILGIDSLAKCVNFDVQEAGDLKVRPAIIQETLVTSTLLGAGTSFFLCNVETDDLGIVWIAGIRYTGAATFLVTFSIDVGLDGVVVVGTVYTLDVTAVFGTNNQIPRFGVHYRGKIYYGTINSAANTIYMFDTVAHTYSSVGTGPVGVGGSNNSIKTAIIFRDRLFLLTERRVYYSTALDPSNFTGTDGGFFDLESPSGGLNTCAAANRTSLYLFKNDSFFSLTYSSNPSDGRVDLINPAIGATGAVTYENHIYFSGNAGVYNLINNNLSQISRVLSAEPNYGVALFGQSLITTENFTRQGSGGWSVQYVYNFRSNAWTTYDFGSALVDFLNYRSVDFNVPNLDRTFFIDFTSGSIFSMDHSYTIYPDSVGGSAAIHAFCRTRDLDSSSMSAISMKRIYNIVCSLWAFDSNIDHTNHTPATASGNCVVAIYDQSTNPLETPLANSMLFPLNYSIPSIGGYQTEKFFASMRAKRYNFNVTIVDSGSMPVTLYELAALVKDKQSQQSEAVQS